MGVSRVHWPYFVCMNGTPLIFRSNKTVFSQLAHFLIWVFRSSEMTFPCPVICPLSDILIWKTFQKFAAEGCVDLFYMISEFLSFIVFTCLCVMKSSWLIYVLTHVFWRNRVSRGLSDRAFYITDYVLYTIRQIKLSCPCISVPTLDKKLLHRCFFQLKHFESSQSTG